MKYIIKTIRPSDPHFLPWDIVVADTKHPNVLTVQKPHPLAGDNLIGFEASHAQMQFTTHDPDWHAMANGLMPVFAGKGEMYTFTDRVTQVIAVEEEVQV